MKCNYIEAGKKTFGNTIDITDPCYRKSTWCRINDVTVVPGEYVCGVFMADRGTWGKRVAYTEMHLSSLDYDPEDTICEEFLGDIGVDSGLAGFFENKPDYSDQQWHDFCNAVNTGHAWILNEGFCSSSGYGDGCYPVYVHRDRSGYIDALEISFLPDAND